MWEKPLNGIVRTLLDKNRDPMADRGNWINQGKLDRKNRERHGNFVYIGCFIEYVFYYLVILYEYSLYLNVLQYFRR